MKKWLSVFGLLVVVLLLTPIVVQAETITRLTVSGPAGENISQGQTHVFTPADGMFEVYHDSNNGITIHFSTVMHPWWWNVQFGGPNATSPQVGVYTNCRRYGFNSSQPGLAVCGDYRCCNELVGSFEVKHLVYSEFDVESLWVTFTLYCDNSSKPLTGEFIYNMDAATSVPRRSWGSLKTMYR